MESEYKTKSTVDKLLELSFLEKVGCIIVFPFVFPFVLLACIIKEIGKGLIEGIVLGIKIAVMILLVTTIISITYKEHKEYIRNLIKEN